MQKLIGLVRRCVEDYNMIEAGDRIAVGVSGGKDSLALLVFLAELRKYNHKPFELEAITIDMGLGMDFSGIQKLCDELEVEYHIVPTDIYKVIFEIRKESNPCALCAKMRRGALNNYAKSIGCTTVALGHHFDDVVDTFMLNLFFEGRIGCFQPVTDLSRVGIRVIRPLIYMPERHVKDFARKVELPVIASPCPADKNTQREEMHNLINELDRKNKGLRYRIYGAIQRGEVDGFKPVGGMTGIKDCAPDDE